MTQDEKAMKKGIRCTIEILKNGKVNVVHPNGDRLETLTPDQLRDKLSGAKIKNIEVSPLSTFLEVNSGYIYINGTWHWYP